MSVHTVYKAVDVNNYAWNFVHKLQELHAFGCLLLLTIIDPSRHARAFVRNYTNVRFRPSRVSKFHFAHHQSEATCISIDDL